jgi:hypothetical protein
MREPVLKNCSNRIPASGERIAIGHGDQFVYAAGVRTASTVRAVRPLVALKI